MRFILLKSDDFEMFHQDIDLFGYEFYFRHKDTFRRMYKEQGKEFWVRFMLSFRSAQSYDILRIFKGKIKRLSDFVDCFYINVHEEFIEGPYSRAKQFFEDIVMVAEDKAYLSILQSHSVAKNPFHRKDTKDIYRRFFGNPYELTSYSKVFILLPLYRRLAGSLCICLRRWMDASEMSDPTNSSYWVPPPPVPAGDVKELPQPDGSTRVDIFKVTLTKDDMIVRSAIKKEDDSSCKGKREKKVPKDNEREKRDSKDGELEKRVSKDDELEKRVLKGEKHFGGRRKHPKDDIVLNKVLLDRLAALFQLSNSYLGQSVALPGTEGFPKKPPQKEQQVCTHCNGCMEMTASERQAKLETLSSEEQAVVRRLEEVAGGEDFGSFGIHLKHIRPTATGDYRIDFKISASKKESGTKQAGDIQNGGIAETKSQETKVQETKGKNSKETKAMVLNKSNVNLEIGAQSKSNVADSKAGKEGGVEKELKTTDNSASRKRARTTENSDVKKDSKATVESDSQEKAIAIRNSYAKKEPNATVECDDSQEKARAIKISDAKHVSVHSDSPEKVKATKESDSRSKPAATTKSKAEQESLATAESASQKTSKAVEESDSRNKAKAMEKSEANKHLKATEGSDTRKKSDAAVQPKSREKPKATENGDAKTESTATEVVPSGEQAQATEAHKSKATSDRDEKELGRPDSKNVRTCTSCGLQEPAPKVFKKCKRCKDEGCLEPPYYCGRDCQVFDWTSRHRQEHEKICA